jgi:hypothetical protein
MMRIVAFGLVAVALAGCGEAAAPRDDGVCWLSQGRPGAPRFTPLARGVENLETCAVLLEARRLQGEAQTNGAYQGYFIFVDANRITSATHAAGLRWPVLQPPQRAAVDRDLTRLMKERGGQMPDAADLSLERR